MKRLSKVLAVGAPTLGILGMLALLDAWKTQPDAQWPARLVDPSHPDFGRTRDLPASGPIAAGAPLRVEAVTVERGRDPVHSLDPMVRERVRAQRQPQ